MSDKTPPFVHGVSRQYSTSVKFTKAALIPRVRPDDSPGRCLIDKTGSPTQFRTFWKNSLPMSEGSDKRQVNL